MHLRRASQSLRARLGLGYEELKKLNDQIIYAAISGFGSAIAMEKV